MMLEQIRIRGMMEGKYRFEVDAEKYVISFDTVEDGRGHRNAVKAGLGGEDWGDGNTSL